MIRFPGPWKVHKCTYPFEGIIEIQTEDGVFVVARCDEEEANLIAKAPEMLELLKEFMDYHKQKAPTLALAISKLLKEIEQ